MINKSANYFEHIAANLGLTIKIPRPQSTARNICFITNGLIGITLTAFVTISKRLSLVLLGMLGIVGAAIIAFEKEEEVSDRL